MPAQRTEIFAAVIRLHRPYERDGITAQSYLHKLVIFKPQAVAYVYAEGEQGQGYFGYYAGIGIADIGVIAPDIYHSTFHGQSLSG